MQTATNTTANATHDHDTCDLAHCQHLERIGILWRRYWWCQEMAATMRRTYGHPANYESEALQLLDELTALGESAQEE